MKFFGMNWVWPMAPAQELTNLSRGMWLVLQDLQRDQQFVAEVGVAVLGVGQRRQRADRVPLVLHRAVGRLHPPDRQDDPALDLEALLDRVEQAAPFGLLAQPRRGALRRGERGHIGAHRLGLFRLARGRRDHARIGRDAGEGQVEGLPRDALGLRVLPKLGDEFLEGGIGGVGAALRLRLRRRR